MADKMIQIKLRDSVPIEKALIEYLASLGTRSGEPKRLLLDGFSLKNIKEVETLNIDKGAPEKKSFANLAVKG